MPAPISFISSYIHQQFQLYKWFNRLPIHIRLLFLCTLLLSGCTDMVKISLPSTTPVLAVDGWITDRIGTDTVFLYKTQNYFNSNPNPGISGAILNLKADNGEGEQLKEVEPGKYLISLRAVRGYTYTLTISYMNQQFTASTKVARSSPRLDSLGFAYLRKGTTVETSGLYTICYGQELPGIGDHARFILYKNRRPANLPGDINLFDDQLIDGKYLSSLQVLQRSPFISGDEISLEAWSLSPDEYGFFDDLRTQLNNAGIFSKTPVNIRTNLTNTHSGGLQVTGYFGSSLVTTVSSLAY